MKTEHWIITLFLIMVPLLVYLNWHTALYDKQTQENIALERDLLSSCLDAMEEAGDGTSLVFENSSQRNKVVDAFYNTFCNCLNLEGEYNRMMAKYYIPCIFLVDSDGYYVCYTRTYRDSANTTVYDDVITGLNTWSESYGDYTIRYGLGDNIMVVSKISSKSAYGPFDKCYADLNAPAEIEFLSTREKFEAERDAVIFEILGEQFNYYVNTHNEFFNHLELDYVFTVPSSYENEVARKIDSPCIFAFAQGIQYSSGEGYMNAYSLAGAIKDRTNTYTLGYADGELYYHEKTCGYRNTDMFSGSMKECAIKGALPCPYCVR